MTNITTQHMGRKCKVRNVPPPRWNTIPDIVWEYYDPFLGTMPDHHIEKNVPPKKGCPCPKQNTLSTRRRTLGIPAYVKPLLSHNKAVNERLRRELSLNPAKELGVYLNKWVCLYPKEVLSLRALKRPTCQ